MLKVRIREKMNKKRFEILCMLKHVFEIVLSEFVGLILHSLWQLTSVDMLENIILVMLRHHKIKLEITGREAKNLAENTTSACCGDARF